MKFTQFSCFAITALAIDICILVLIITSYIEKYKNKKKWRKIIVRIDDEAETNQVYNLECDEILVGRHNSVDIRIPNLSVSRYHAILNITDGQWNITDIGSKSGVLINGVNVQQALLRENDIITLGNCNLIFRKRKMKA